MAFQGNHLYLGVIGNRIQIAIETQLEFGMYLKPKPVDFFLPITLENFEEFTANYFFPTLL